MNTRKTGEHYEQVAGAFLERHGYQILEYNFRCRYAEIDIVARDGEYLVFCEIKYRSNANMCTAMEAVNSRKQHRISLAALFYLHAHHYTNFSCRFDVIGISGNHIRLIKNAFQFTGV